MWTEKHEGKSSEEGGDGPYHWSSSNWNKDFMALEPHMFIDFGEWTFTLLDTPCCAHPDKATKSGQRVRLCDLTTLSWYQNYKLARAPESGWFYTVVQWELEQGPWAWRGKPVTLVLIGKGRGSRSQGHLRQQESKYKTNKSWSRSQPGKLKALYGIPLQLCNSPSGLSKFQAFEPQ